MVLLVQWLQHHPADPQFLDFLMVRQVQLVLVDLENLSIQPFLMVQQGLLVRLDPEVPPSRWIQYLLELQQTQEYPPVPGTQEILWDQLVMLDQCLPLDHSTLCYLRYQGRQQIRSALESLKDQRAQLGLPVLADPTRLDSQVLH